MPTRNITIEQKRPLYATPERALAMYRAGKIRQREIAQLWGISRSRVSRLIKQGLNNEHTAEVMARALKIAEENQNGNDSLHARE